MFPLLRARGGKRKPVSVAPQNPGDRGGWRPGQGSALPEARPGGRWVVDGRRLGKLWRPRLKSSPLGVDKARTIVGVGWVDVETPGGGTAAAERRV